jgi:hypothetical protein
MWAWGQEAQREEKNLTRPTRLEMSPSLIIDESLCIVRVEGIKKKGSYPKSVR